MAPPAPTVHAVAPMEAAQQLRSWNAGRSSLPGINSHPLPANASLRQTPNGRYVISTPNGPAYVLNNQGRIGAYFRGNVSAAIDTNGRLQSVRSPGMVVMHSLFGGRRVESVGQNGSHVVSYGLHRGYMDHVVSVGGRPLLERTRISNGQVNVSHYQTYSYNGFVIEDYVPNTYYSPGFYAWLHAPWGASVVLAAPSGSSSLPAAYSSYYQPEASYASPSMLLADQVISAQLENVSLETSSVARDPSSSSMYGDLPRISAPTTTPITREVKAGFATQVTSIISDDQQVARTGTLAPARAIPTALDPTIEYFFVDEGLDVKTTRGDSHCALSQGVALHRVELVPPSAKEADLLVVSGLKGDCPTGTHVLVAIPDLQSMSNHCHESLGPALSKLAGGAGHHGLAGEPPSGVHFAVPEAGPAELAAKGKMADAAIAEQQTQSLKLESDTNADMQTSLQ